MIDFKRIFIKSIRTMAQTLVGVLPASGLFWAWDWRPIVSATIVSGVVCFLMGIADTDNVVYLEEHDESYVDDPDDDEIIEH